MGSEPILWVRHGYQPPSRRLGFDEHGEPIIEKFPATAPPPEDHPLHGKPVRRWELMLDDCGNVVRTVYTGGAADYLVDHPNYGAPLKARHRKNGWFPYGACPLVLAHGGYLSPMHLSNDVRRHEPCEPGTYSAARPCKHALAEERARKDRQNRREAKRAEAFRSEAEKTTRMAQETQSKTADATLQVMQQLSSTIEKLIGGGGKWPLGRPNLDAEQFEKELHEGRGNLPPEAPTSDDELARMLAEADAADIDAAEPVTPIEQPTEPAPTGKKGRTK